MCTKEEQGIRLGKTFFTPWQYSTPYSKVLTDVLIIIRDGEFNNIVNVVPLEGGFVLVKKPKDFGGIIL